MDDRLRTLLVGHLTVGRITGSITRWLLHFHGAAAYGLVGALVFAEEALLVGFFLPGETAAVIGGVLAAAGSANLEFMMTVVVLSAITGDSVGYIVGRTAGPWLLERRPLRGSTAVARTMRLLERRGGSAVFIGRFVTFARAVVPGLSGMSGLRYRTFPTFNVLGGLLWGVGYTFAQIVSDLSTASLVAVAVVGMAVAIYVLGGRHGRKRASGNENTATPGAGLPPERKTVGTPS